MAGLPQPPRRTSLGRRLLLSLVTMLLPLALLAGLALYTQWGSSAEQEGIERETVEEFVVIGRARDAAERLRDESAAAAEAPRAHTIGRAAEARAALDHALDDLVRSVDNATERRHATQARDAAGRGDVEGVENALTAVRTSSLHELTSESADV